MYVMFDMTDGTSKQHENVPWNVLIQTQKHLAILKASFVCDLLDALLNFWSIAVYYNYYCGA